MRHHDGSLESFCASSAAPAAQTARSVRPSRSRAEAFTRLLAFLVHSVPDVEYLHLANLLSTQLGQLKHLKGIKLGKTGWMCTGRLARYWKHGGRMERLALPRVAVRDEDSDRELQALVGSWSYGRGSGVRREDAVAASREGAWMDALCKMPMFCEQADGTSGAAGFFAALAPQGSAAASSHGGGRTRKRRRGECELLLQ